MMVGAWFHECIFGLSSNERVHNFEPPNMRLLRNSCGWYEREAQAGCLALQVTGLPFTELPFILLGAHVGVFHFEL
jgi:hypothetical protein